MMSEPERTTSYPAEPASRATVLAVMRGIALPVYLPSFFSAIAQNAMQIMLPLYALEIGGGPALAATVVGLRGAGTMLMDVPAGMLVTRIGDRGVMRFWDSWPRRSPPSWLQPRPKSRSFPLPRSASAPARASGCSEG